MHSLSLVVVLLKNSGSRLSICSNVFKKKESNFLKPSNFIEMFLDTVKSGNKICKT